MRGKVLKPAFWLRIPVTNNYNFSFILPIENFFLCFFYVCASRPTRNLFLSCIKQDFSIRLWEVETMSNSCIMDRKQYLFSSLYYNALMRSNNLFSMGVYHWQPTWIRTPDSGSSFLIYLGVHLNRAFKDILEVYHRTQHYRCLVLYISWISSWNILSIYRLNHWCNQIP